MGMFGGQRQRALAQFNSPRNAGGDGLAFAAPAMGSMPPGYPVTPEAVLAGGFPMPGIIGGYGGGTFNLDGSQATPVQRGGPALANQYPPAQQPVANPSGILSAGRSAVPSAPSLFQMPNIDGSPMTFEGVKPSKPKQGAGFFSKNGAWRDVLGAIGDSLSGNPLYQNTKLQRMQTEREDAKLQQNRLWQIEDRTWKASQPDYFTVGRDRVKLNPMTGESQVVYDGPEDFDEYATAMGLQPGSDEYEGAVLDYVLRGHGPTALGIDKELDDYRTVNDKGYDDYRTRNRLKVRGTPTYRDRNPLPPRSSPRKSAAPPVIAVNPKTGEKLMVDGRGNWVPYK